MNPHLPRLLRHAGVLAGAGLISLLGGCYTHSAGYAEVSTGGPVFLDDDYVYYPGYETYYSTIHHQYVYRDGRNWVRRPAPPRPYVNVLPSAPSVHVDFRDPPERHHADVIRTYPRNWKPPAPKPPPSPRPRQDDRHDNDHRDDKRN